MYVVGYLECSILKYIFVGSWRKIYANRVIWVMGSDVARHKTPCEPKGNIIDDLSQCINEDIYIYIYIYIVTGNV